VQAAVVELQIAEGVERPAQVGVEVAGAPRGTTSTVPWPAAMRPSAEPAKRLRASYSTTATGPV
jgi:hypothetical protein